MYVIIYYLCIECEVILSIFLFFFFFFSSRRRHTRYWRDWSSDVCSSDLPPRKVPNRDASFMTNVAGCYIVGDVSGTPLIKNAANEGTDCVRHIYDELRRNGTAPEPKSDVEVVIIGVGPAGLSAAITAERLGLSYAAIEQDKVLATIDAYPANKYVFFKPETMESRGDLSVEGARSEERRVGKECRSR